MTNTLKIRQMTPPDLQLALNWAALEGWNPGLNDATAFYATDNAGFLIGEIDGEAIGCISAVCYDTTFAFIGLYIVKKEWRGQRCGMQIWQAAWQQLTERLEENQRCVALDGVVEREGTYRKNGFVPAYRHIRHIYNNINNKNINFNSSEALPTDVVPLINIPFAEVVRYDTELFGISRPQFLQHWINPESGAAYGVEENGKLRGYGVLRSCHQGYKIGPLFADNLEIAESLFQALTNHAGTQSVFLDIPDINPALTFFTQRYNLQPVFTCVRMYCYRTPSTDVNRIFGVTTLELG
jgi:GNAT superfamily N-acetyltransferase